MTEAVQPPPDLWKHQWHQLQAVSNKIIERMEWLSHADAIEAGRVHPGHPDGGGFWIRSGTPLTAQQMQTAGWCYLRPCTANAPLVTWDETNRWLQESDHEHHEDAQ